MLSGSTITFGDGSTYSTHTGEFVNRGPGHVKVNGNIIGEGKDHSPTPVDEIVTMTKTYTAKSLDINVRGTTVVKTHSEPTMRVEITGPTSAVDSIRLSQMLGRLRIRGGSTTSSVNNIRTTGGVHISNISQSVSIGTPSVKVTIYVPRGTSITACADMSAAVTIDNVNGDAKLKADMSGTITLEGSYGNVELTSDMSGCVIINGDIDTLRASANMSSHIDVWGTVKRTQRLKADMSGTINIDRVIQQDEPPRQFMNGRVRIRRVG